MQKKKKGRLVKVTLGIFKAKNLEEKGEYIKALEEYKKLGLSKDEFAENLKRLMKKELDEYRPKKEYKKKRHLAPAPL